jgi:hypothetical protein
VAGKAGVVRFPLFPDQGLINHGEISF